MTMMNITHRPFCAAIVVATARLDVFAPDTPWRHNSNRVAVIENVSPQFADSLWIDFIGDQGGEGYLNALLIEEVQTGPGAIAFLTSNKLPGRFWSLLSGKIM
jgi:hypothetical protein